LLVTLCARGGVKLDRDLAKELARYVGYYPNLVQEIGYIAFNHLVENKMISIGQITKEWGENSGYQWIGMIVSPFKEKFEGTTADLIGLKEEDYLTKSLEAYGIFLRDENEKLAIAPYISDLLKLRGEEQSLESLQNLAAKNATQKQSDTSNVQVVHNNFPSSIHIEKGEIIMGDKFIAGNNVGGVQNIGRFDLIGALKFIPDVVKAATALAPILASLAK